MSDKYYILADELYPYYTILEDPEGFPEEDLVELPLDLVKRVAAVEKEFMAVQDLLAEALDENN